MPDSRPTLPTDDLETRLDALGRGLAAIESCAPPPVIASAVHQRAASTLRFRIAVGGAMVAAIGGIALAFFVSRPAGGPGPLPAPPRAELRPTPDPANEPPTLAVLRALNRSVAPEHLRLPTGPTSASAGPADPLRASSARDSEALRRLLGPDR